MASRWRELHGSDSWKGSWTRWTSTSDAPSSLTASLRRPPDRFNLEKRSPHAGLCLYSRDRLLSASTVTHPEYYKVTKFLNAEVHRGFLSVYTSSDNNSMYNKTSAREQVLEEVGRLMKEYKEEVTSITVTGHSLGASLATLTAIDMVANDVNVPPASNQPPCPVTAILLASPRVGNDAFKSAFGSFDHLRALHVANAKDIVPMNPPSVLLLMQYVDSATVTIVIDTDRSPYVVHKMLTHHVLELYLHGVAGDHGDKADFQLVVPRDLALVNKTTDLLNDEHQVPACWWVIHRKCMAKGTDGQWKLDDFEEA
ncbi:hypothetical protein ZWY2020_042027 [Hordeum vulgare]|nr:hypothetical protein ZWY2020_042027 [Hordeum vulgare]